ncbi:MAG TPA: hypothetical protein VGL99_05275 [Chloroflexota bacterium]
MQPRSYAEVRQAMLERASFFADAAHMGGEQATPVIVEWIVRYLAR